MRYAIGLLLLSILLPGCGYHLSGTGKNLPPEARTIAIPKFANESQRPEATAFVTRAIQDEFITRSRLALANSIAGADLLLEGKIVSFAAKPVSPDHDRMRGGYELSVVLDVKLVDRLQSRLLYQNNGLLFQETYQSTSADFFAQETESLKKIAHRFAAFVVASMLENF